jgi:parallel beta-helix repeat protein
MSIQIRTLTIGLLTICLLIVAIQKPVYAGSVYAIPNHTDKILKVYDILEGYEEGKLEERGIYDLSFSGGADVTVDVNSDILFVTFEDEKRIELINARTFLSEGIVVAAEASDLAGVILSYPDPNTSHVFTVDRGTYELYAYEWDAMTKTLTPITPDPNDPDNPNYGNDVSYYLLEPEDPNDSDVMACGLALDPATDLLYVSQFKRNTFSNIVYVYDIQDFETAYFPLVRTIDLGEYEGQDNYAVDIDVDSDNGWLYAGGYTSHNNLIRFDLEEDDPNATGYGGHIQDIGAGVIGLAVSPGKRFVYATTYNSLLETWDTNLPMVGGWERIDEEEISSGGAGVCVADVDYIPPFEVDKVADVNDCVIPRAGEEITYTISYWYNWTEEGDPNLYEFESIYIKDSLPREVDFVSASPNPGYYDEDTHSYIWSITPETYGDPNSIEITVEINNKVTPGGYIENAVVEIVTDIYGQEYVETAEVETSICECGDNGVIWYVVEDAVGEGTSWGDAFGTIEQALNAAFPCDEIWVAEGTYTPVEEPNLVNHVGLYGGFYGDESERYERDWSEWAVVICGDINSNDDLNKSFSDPNRMMGDNLDYVLKAHDWITWTVVDGFTIQRGRIANIYCEGSSLLIEHNNIIDSPIGVYCDETDIMGIRNNWIYANGDGIYLTESANEAIIRNNTIVDNDSIGILVDSGEEPEIINCIFWDNDANDMIGCYATYSCIEEPTHFWDESDPNNPVYLGIGEGNIDDDPLFKFETSDYDYHLSSSSPCYNAGDPNLSYSYQRDIDKHMRVIEKRVDIGADEFCDPESDSDADFNEDDIVNLLDFDEFSEVWLVESSDPNWNSLYDLAGDGDIIDSNDLLLFAEDWLWISCSKMKEIDLDPPESMQMGGIGKMMSEKVLFMESTLSIEQTTVKPEPTIEEQISEVKWIIEKLEEIWEDEETKEAIDEEDWKKFMDSIYEWLSELEDLYLKEQKL